MFYRTYVKQGGNMNWFKRNMFGELNWICYLFGHKWCIYGSGNGVALCMRCELDNPKLRTNGGKNE